MASPSGSDTSPLAQYSPVLRVTSRTFTGGAYSTPSYSDAAATETTPMRQSARAIAAQSNHLLQDRVQQELFSGSRLRHVSFFLIFVGLLLVICLIALAFTMLVLCVRAVLGTVNNLHEPCDQPLKYYMLVSLLWSFFGEAIISPISKIVKRACCIDEARQTLCGTLVQILPGLAVLGWGVYMIEQADTCPKTNPGLYYPTKDWIIAQLVFTSVLLLSLILFSFGGFMMLLSLQSALDRSPGCEAAVHKLPKVHIDSKELINEEDAQVKDCVICLTDLSVGGCHIVRTPCSHHFHEECLANWCKNHMDCPLCRAPIGEPDPDDQPAEP